MIGAIFRYDSDSVRQGRIIPPDCETSTFFHDIPLLGLKIGRHRSDTVAPYGAQSGEGGKGTIVYGHGVFTSGRDDFLGPFGMLRDIEERCRRAYFSLVEGYQCFGDA